MYREEVYKLYLIGYPIKHSLSPYIMNYIYEEVGLKASYSIYETKSNLGKTIEKFRLENVYGFNITIPYKEEIIKFLDEFSDDVYDIGAVNTVYNLDGILKGYNTDWIGVYKSITRFGRSKYDKALIIGAGGAARAAIYALKDIASTLYIANRSFDRALELSKKFRNLYRRIYPIPLYHEGIEEVINNVDIIINATPVGMKLGDKPIPTDNIKAGCIVIDMIYKPLETQLIRDASQNGAKTIDGLWMLIYQAIEAVDIWFRIKFDANQVRRYILDEVLTNGGLW